ncbi:CopD family protein [Isoptericola sp. AK164]|uniref:copper resistance CopC/CopD family protein n=1 Tax=Isoptericola sp. AK164 TaxID=3024246 RepID=UPI0024186ADB|nr:CopD family protein [Isoptericola sp. AK164]
MTARRTGAALRAAPALPVRPHGRPGRVHHPEIPHRRILAPAGAVLLGLMLLLAGAVPAQAHTDLDTVEPADGSTADGPVEEVVLTFTLPVTPLGEAVEVTGPEGAVPVQVTPQQDGVVLLATPEEPLTDGDYTLDWSVAAEDGHPLDGTVAFTVTGAAPDGGSTDDGDAGEDAAPDAEGSPTAAPDAEAAADPEVAADEEDAAGFAAVVARLAGAAVLWGALVAGGGLLFAALVLRGRDREEVPAVLTAVRWVGVLALVGVPLRLAARSVVVAQGDVAAAVSPSALADALTGDTGLVLGLQAAGALAVLLGARRTLAGSWLALVGTLLLGAGIVLDGHSNSVGPHWLVVTTDVTHLLAAAAWVGGVVMVGVVLRRRRRDARPLDAGLLGSRFSVLATASVVVVGIAGVGLTVAILDRPSQLWETSWGLFLLAKVAVVAVVAAIGAHQHFRVVPLLQAPGHGARRAHKAGSLLQRGAGHETGFMVVVVLLTAWLVAASVHE